MHGISLTHLCSLLDDHGKATIHLVLLGEGLSELLGTKMRCGQ